MDKRKFAFIMMGADHDPKRDELCLEGEQVITYICGVRNFEEAKEKVMELKEKGVGALELCGAFGREKAKELIELTCNEVAIGYVVHEPEQDPLFAQFFGD